MDSSEEEEIREELIDVETEERGHYNRDFVPKIVEVLCYQLQVFLRSHS